MRGMGISIIRTWSAVLERCTVRVFDILKAYESHVYASRRVRVPNDLGVTPGFARYDQEAMTTVPYSYSSIQYQHVPYSINVRYRYEYRRYRKCKVPVRDRFWACVRLWIRTRTSTVYFSFPFISLYVSDLSNVIKVPYILY